MKQNLTVKDTATADRPRERLIESGSDALSNSELLAIIIRSGSRNEPVTILSKRLLKYFDNNLLNLARATHAELLKLKGIGPAKAAEIVAAFTLAKRLKKASGNEKIKISGPESAAEYLIPKLQSQTQEEFHVILLDTKNCVIKDILVTKGLLDRSHVHAREVFRSAIHHNSHKVLLAHNHPSGDPTPSGDDLNSTKKLVQSGELLGIEVIDHLIVGQSHPGQKPYTSLKEQGLM